MHCYPVPSPEFCRQLRAFDPNLQLNFDPAHGVWAIWCKDPYSGALDHVMNVVNADGSYRELDGHVFQVLRMNRFYQQNPHLLVKNLFDDFEEKQKRAEERSKKNAQYLAQDQSLKREFDQIVERLRAVPLEDFLKPVVAKDKDGNPIRLNQNPDGTGGEMLFRYKPDSDLMQYGTRILLEEYNQ